MQTKIQRHGDTFIIQIPSALVQATGLYTDSIVELRLVNGEIHIVPGQRKRYELVELLDGITEDNLHAEIDTGDSIGNEAL